MLNINLMLMSVVVPGIIGALIGIAVAVPSVYFTIRYVQKNKASKDAAHAKSVLEEAKQEAKNLKKEAILEHK